MRAADIGEFEEEIEEAPDFVPEEWIVPVKPIPVPAGA
jgi:hypothetical protein